MKHPFKLWRIRLLLFLAVVGPGFITANVDNDAGCIFTYSQSGAQFGYAQLWTMLPMTLALIVVQEMCARMGAVTGKGLSDLIREEFGFRITFIMMVGLIITNFGNVMAEFEGISLSLELLGVRAWISVPICAVVVWLLVVKGSYKGVEKIFLAASFFYFCYLIAGVLAHPAWRQAGVETVIPPHWHDFKSSAYLYMVIALVGTTIAPWMQFYLQSSVVEKGITAKQYSASRLDVIIGCIFTDVVAWFIVVACAATLYVHGIHDIKSATEAAQALKPLAGKYAYILFAAGFFNASLFAASILPISTAYTVCEGLGFESGVDKKFGEAPMFYWLYTALIVAGGAMVVILGHDLAPKVILASQVVNGVVLPFVLIAMLVLINKRELMGKHVNGHFFNWVAWATTFIMIGLTIAYLWSQFAGS